MSFTTTERRTTLANARAIVDRAKAADRELTTAESDQVEAAITQVQDLDRRTKSGDLARRVMPLGGVDRETDPGSPGLFTEDAKAGIVYAAKTGIAYRTTVEAKAALTTGTMLPTAGQGVQPGTYPGGVFPLSSLFRQEQAPGPTIRYYRMGAGTAAVVAEGVLKPDAGVTITPVDLSLEKLACLSQFSTEMAEDAPFLVSYLQAELPPRCPEGPGDELARCCADARSVSSRSGSRRGSARECRRCRWRAGRDAVADLSGGPPARAPCPPRSAAWQAPARRCPCLRGACRWQLRMRLTGLHPRA